MLLSGACFVQKCYNVKKSTANIYSCLGKRFKAKARQMKSSEMKTTLGQSRMPFVISHTGAGALLQAAELFWKEG